jgi:hypothetical protein
MSLLLGSNTPKIGNGPGPERIIMLRCEYAAEEGEKSEEELDKAT